MRQGVHIRFWPLLGLAVWLAGACPGDPAEMGPLYTGPDQGREGGAGGQPRDAASHGSGMGGMDSGAGGDLGGDDPELDAGQDAEVDAGGTAAGSGDAGVGPDQPALDTPAPRVSVPEVVGVLIGPDAPYRKPGLVLHGADLGFPYLFEDRLYLHFGDTTESPASLCSDQGNDDALGWLPATFSGSLPAIEIATQPDAPQAFQPVQLLRAGRPLPLTLGRVPVGAFVDGGRVFSFFNRLELARCAADGSAPCASPGFTCTERVGQCEPARSVVVPPLCDRSTGRGCVVGQVCGEADQGLCFDPTVSQYEDSAAGEIAAAVHVLDIGLRRADDPTVYDQVATFATAKFSNPALRTVTAWSGMRSGNDYRPGNGALLIWGRPGFVAASPGRAQLYLMAHPLPMALDETGSLVFAPVYFAGIEPESGEPRWSDRQSDARPIALDGQAGGDPAEPISIVAQMSVSWLGPPIRKWVMLYGGDISDFLVQDPAAVRDGPAPGSIAIRFADHPWGPFTEPEPHLLPGDPSRAGDGYGPGGILYHPDCRDSQQAACAIADAERIDGASCLEAVALWEQGRLYGAMILDPYTATNAQGGLDMIWNVSTWNPYHVVMMKTSFTAR